MFYNALIAVMSFVMASIDSPPAVCTAGDVVARMMAHDRERQSMLHGYTAMRRYVLENRSHNKRAEMVVRMTYGPDGSKQFEVVSMDGWGGARKHVFTLLLKAETEAARPDLVERSRITPENYTFELAGTESVRGRPAYVMAI